MPRGVADLEQVVQVFGPDGPGFLLVAVDEVLLVGDVVRFPAAGPALDQLRVEIPDPADLAYGQEPPDSARGVEPSVAGQQELPVAGREYGAQSCFERRELLGGRTGRSQPAGRPYRVRKGLGALLLVQDRVEPFVAPALEQLAPWVNGGAELGCGLVLFGVRHG